MTYPTTQATNISLTYDARLRPITYEAESGANTTDIHNKTYTYNNDGSIKQATNTLDADYTQTYEYDFAARLKKNEVGGPSGRYRQTLGFDAFDHLTSRSTIFVGTARNFTAGFTNNRKTSGGYGGGWDSFDAAGNVIRNTISSTPPVDWRNWKYDAAGRVSDWEETSAYAGITRWDQGEELTFDGDDRAVRRVERKRTWGSPPSDWSYIYTYGVYSTVLGRKLVELDSSGQWTKRNIYVNGALIAEVTPSKLVFKHIDPVNGSENQTEASGELSPFSAGRVERESLGGIIPTSVPEVLEPPRYRGGGALTNPEKQCVLNGQLEDCGQMHDRLRAWGLLFAGSHLVEWPTHVDLSEPADYGLVSPEFIHIRGLLNEGEPAKHPTRERFGECLKQFGEGTVFDGVRAEGDTVIFTITIAGEGPTEFKITLGAFSAEQLGKDAAIDKNLAWDGTRQSAYTFANNPQRSFIASEVVNDTASGINSAMGLQALAYHELGNGIAGKIYYDEYSRRVSQGRSVNDMKHPFYDKKIDPPDNDKDHRDSGLKFERCLFGGMVNLRTGRVGNVRGFHLSTP